MPPEPMLDALDLTVRLIAVGVVIMSVELILDRYAFGPAGPFSAQMFAILRGGRTPSALQSADAVTAIAATQLVAGVVLVALGPLAAAGRVALVTVTVMHMLLRWRRVIGGDGAEQMSSIVLIASALALLPGPDEWRAGAAVTFIAGQTTLAYVTAGAAKLASPVWRSGQAVPAILNTRVHGLATASRIVTLERHAGPVADWAVIGFEVLFPAVFVAPEPLAAAILGVGLAFHVACAVAMGLNGFLWAFPATYVAVFAVRDALVG